MAASILKPGSFPQGPGCPLFLSTWCSETAKQPLSQFLYLGRTWPLLWQHNLPYQQEQLWLKLEERAVIQLWVSLRKQWLIKRWMWVIIEWILFEARNIVSYHVGLCADPLWIDAKWWVDQKQTEEPGEETANLGLSAGATSPAQQRSVVGYIEEDWVWVVGDAWR